MPHSDNSNIEWSLWLFDQIKPTSIIDIGPGAGKYGILAKQYNQEIKTTAVEIWAPYIEEFNLRSIYDTVHICDAKIYPDYSCDLVILGDVLEHMKKEDAIYLWNKIKKEAKAAMISIPIIHYPQGAEHNNPYETHLEDHWTHEDVLDTFPGITGYQVFEITASYVADFTRDS
jgi:hypothetical protein